MEDRRTLDYVGEVLESMPNSWLTQTTHRLDIYDEKRAKTHFLEEFEVLFNSHNSKSATLGNLPTAYDYIRLGHPLSCLLEWSMAKLYGIKSENVISFSSKSMPVLAVLRSNLLKRKKTQILYSGDLPPIFKTEILRTVYGYNYELKKVDKEIRISAFNGSRIFITEKENFEMDDFTSTVDFVIKIYANFGSILLINGDLNKDYISEIQHVRRRETIAMTPANSLAVLKNLIGKNEFNNKGGNEANKTKVLKTINKLTGTKTKALIASSGLSIQYAIVMALIEEALENHKGKAIKIIVPPNCYGGTNDQARRVAACLENVEVVDLDVDGLNDMVHSIDVILGKIASEDAIPYIIAEIPTNPRVEVPDLLKLKEVLSKERKTEAGKIAVDPVFVLDQTFCPNVSFLGAGETLGSVRALAYVSGSKFPSGGLCTAGYCVGNKKTDSLILKTERHLSLCDNHATVLQIELLEKQLPSMNQRIKDAYENTRHFVSFINSVLPAAKINFVSEELAEKGFTPSVFSLDLPTKGSSSQEKEANKRELNLKLIDLMIQKIPDESKFCVSYGQLNGCYWTIPATSTQGTTKEKDKDYIVRVSLSPVVDIERHKKVFISFIETNY